MSELLRRVMLNDYTAYNGRVRDVRILRVRPSNDGETRVEGDVLFACAQPYEGIFGGKVPVHELPFHDISRWGQGKDPHVIAYRLSTDGRESAAVPSWNKVRQLHFDIEHGGANRLLDFYREYGPLGYHHYVKTHSLAWNPDGWHWEPLEWVRVALDTFQHLVALVDWTEKKRLSPLRERFGDPKETTAPDITLGGRLGCEPWRIRWYTWPKDVHKGTYRIPDDDELFKAAWEAVLEWFASWFAPGQPDSVLAAIQHPQRRNIEFVIMASTLIEYAIAQFYLERVSGLKGSCRTCHVPLATGKDECADCGNVRRVQEHRERLRLDDERNGTSFTLLKTYKDRLYRAARSGKLTEDERRNIQRKLEGMAAALPWDEFRVEADRLVPKQQGRR